MGCPFIPDWMDLLFLADLAKLALQRHRIQTVKGQRQQQLDTASQHHCGVPECLDLLLFGACHCCWIGQTPVRRDWVAWPKRADFASCVITDSKNEVEHGCLRRHKFVPTLAAITRVRHVQSLQRCECLRMNFAFGVTAGRKRTKLSFTQFIQDALRENGAGRVAGADEQYVVSGVCGHSLLSQQQWGWVDIQAC